jgi:hypothetical protein
VRINVSGNSKTQDFAILRNARVPGVTDADLAAQFALAKQINDRVSTANAAVIRIRALKEQIAARVGKTSSAALKALAQSLADRLTSIEGEIYQHRNRSNQDPLNYPIRLNNKLAALQGVVEMGDARPTDQSQAIFKDLSARLDQELARLDAAVKTDVAALNKLLSAESLEPIVDRMD